jgi:hypothetical protein
MACRSARGTLTKQRHVGDRGATSCGAIGDHTQGACALSKNLAVERGSLVPLAAIVSVQPTSARDRE